MSSVPVLYQKTLLDELIGTQRTLVGQVAGVYAAFVDQLVAV